MKKFLFLTLILSLTSTKTVQAQGNASSLQQMEAQALVLQEQGQYSKASKLWTALRQRYRKRGLSEKAAEAAVQLASNQNSLGLKVSACFTLQDILKIQESLCVPAREIQPIISPPILRSENDAIAASLLARILRDMGVYDQALLLSDQSLVWAKDNGIDVLLDDLIIVHSNIKRVQLQQEFDQRKYRGNSLYTEQESEAYIKSYESTFQGYEASFNGESGFDARLKWLGLYQQLGDQSGWISNERIRTYYLSLESQYLENLTWASDYEFEPFSPFNQTEQLRLLAKQTKVLLKANASEAKPQLQQLLDEAYRQNSEHYSAMAYAMLGGWYQQRGDSKKAIGAYQRASELGDKRLPLFQYQYEMATAFERLGNARQAKRFYASAISLIEIVQDDISPVVSDLKRNFQESVRPIYDRYLELKLNEESPDFQAILSLRNQLREKSLENYLGCGTLTTIAFNEVFDVDPQAQMVSIFQAGNHYHTVIQTSRGYQYSRVNQSDVIGLVQETRLLLDTGSNLSSQGILRTKLQRLYDLLLAPLADELETGKTLIFSMDASLQQIPVSMLNDGDRYLIERYPMALITPQLYSPRPLSMAEREQILFAGLSEARNDFSSLPFVEDEQRAINPQKSFLNSRFTRSRLLESLAKNNPIVHIASHGQFSSNPNQTFLIAWDEQVTLDSLVSVVSDRAENTPNPIELLILSACETAKGDGLATLGMAGIAVQAGTRSTIASLWRSEDESTSLLFDRFYQELRQGKSKAEALQLAQVSLIQEGRSPYVWGNFVLVGSWL